MPFTDLQIKLGKTLPLVATAIAISVCVICIAITLPDDGYYKGGLDWPYFSDMGRESTSYYFFAIGLTIVGILMAMIWGINYMYQKELVLEVFADGNSVGILRKQKTVLILGILASGGLPVLAIFDTSNYASLHIYAAYWFVALEAVATGINTSVSRSIYKGSLDDRKMIDPETAQSAKLVYKWQAITVCIFWVAFLLYIPIGLAIVCSFARLSIDECESLNLGVEYCTETVRMNETHTLLWNYCKKTMLNDDEKSLSNHVANCVAENHIRTVSQLIVVLSLVIYVISVSKHHYERGIPISPANTMLP